MCYTVQANGHHFQCKVPTCGAMIQSPAKRGFVSNLLADETTETCGQKKWARKCSRLPRKNQRNQTHLLKRPLRLQQAFCETALSEDVPNLFDKRLVHERRVFDLGEFFQKFALFFG